MSVYKRGQIWWIKFTIDGTVVRRSSGATSKREAQKRERELRFEFADKTQASRVRFGSERTYQEAILKWIQSGAPKSMWSHARNTRPYLDNVLLHQVVPHAHNMKQSMLADGLKVTTINRRLAVVRRILNVAYREWDWLKEPLGQKIQLMSEKGTEREIYLSKEEVEALVGLIEDPDVRNIALLAAYTGLRLGELRNLTPKNWQKPYIVLDSKTKGKKPRVVPVIEDLHPIMESTNFGLSEWEVRKSFEAAREAMERPDIHFHDLRHTFASWLVTDPAIPLTVIRDLMGHANLTVTSKYAHLQGIDPSIISDALKKK